MNKIVICGLIFLCCALLTQGQSNAKIVSAEYTINELSIISSSMTVGLVNVTFDQPVYGVDSLPCPPIQPPFSCDKLKCACDYTSKDPAVCGVAPAGCPECPNKDTLCAANIDGRPETQWTTITANDENDIQFFCTATEMSFFRYYHSDPCKGFKIRIEVGGATKSMMLSWKKVYTTDETYNIYQPERAVTNFPQSYEPSYCPTDVNTFNIGTLFITVFDSGVYYDPYIANISIFSADIPKELPPLTQDLTVKKEGYLPMQNGVLYDSVVPNTTYTYYYSYTITECQVLSIRAYGTFDPGYYINPYIFMQSHPDIEPTEIPEWFSSRSSEENYFTLALCPEPGQTELTLYIGVQGVNPSNEWHFSITTNAPKYKLELTDKLVYNGNTDWINSAYFTSGNATLSCPHYYNCAGFTGIYPGINPNAFFPRPYFVYTLNPLELLYMDWSQVDVKKVGNNVYQAVAYLHYDIVGDELTMISEEDFAKGQIHIRGVLVDGDFNPINSVSSITKAPPRCDYNTFLAQRGVISNYLTQIRNETDDKKLRQTFLHLDLNLAFNAWSECQQYGESFTNFGVAYEEVTTTKCTAAAGSDEFKADPCCNPLAWETACVAKLKKLPTRVVESNNPALISQHCESPTCADPQVAAFAQVSINIDSCKPPSTNYNSFLQSTWLLIRGCSEKVYDNVIGTFFCNADSDCGQDVTGVSSAQCDLMSRRCVSSLASREALYTQCIADTMPSLGNLNYLLLNALGLSSTAAPAAVATALQEQFTADDCILAYETPYLDLSLRKHQKFAPYDPGCGDTFKCETLTCKDRACNLLPDRCSYFCYRLWRDPFPGVTAAVCNTSYYMCNAGADCSALNQTECESACAAAAAGSYCGVKVNSHTILPIPGVTTTDATACAATAACVTADGTAAALDATACAATSKCDIPCNGCDQAGCEGTGTCSDSLLFPVGGGCIIPYRVNPDYSIRPVCEDPMVYTPLGCLYLPLNTIDSCTANGGKWYNRATTKEECTSQHSCLEYDHITFMRTNLPQRYGPKDETQCALAELMWVPSWTWTPGHWTKGVVATPQVATRAVVSQYHQEPALDFEAVQDLLTGIVTDAVETSYQADAYCRVNRIANTLTNLVCDCTASGQKATNCYLNDPQVLTAFVHPCVGTGEEVNIGSSSVTTTSETISGGCADVLVYELQRGAFFAPAPVRLAAYFASFEPVSSYAVKNSNGGIIGEVLGDGVVLSTSSDLKQVTICMLITNPSTNPNYGVYDFADTTSDYAYVTPRNVNAYEKEGYVCGEVDVPVTSNAIYVPIKRVSNWQSTSTSFFSKQSTALLYTLGVLYIVIAAFAFIQIAIRVALKLAGKKKMGSNPAIIITGTIFVFTIIRAIYFFLVPTGALSEGASSAEYILIIFPTFPYFTAFSCIPIVWISLTTGTSLVGNTRTKINKAIMGVNVVLYLVFLIIVLIFNYSKTTVNTVCFGKAVTTGAEASAQTNVAIAYAVIIAAFSLIIAVAFVFYGHRVVTIAGSERVMRKTYRLACICALAFLLNCLFNLIITGAKLENIGFSFAGLIISEIIPAVYILIFFGLLKDLVGGKKGGSSSLGASGSSTASTTAVSSSASASVSDSDTSSRNDL